MFLIKNIKNNNLSIFEINFHFLKFLFQTHLKFKNKFKL